MNRKQIEQNLILLGLSGSRAYGTFIEGQSDWEYKGVCIGPLSNYFGLTTFEQKDNGWNSEPGDIPELNNTDNVVYEIKKYISLCQKQNPNLLELMFLDKHVFVSPIGQKLIDNRDLFLSKKVKGAYCGYSYSQLKRVETHRKWLLQPPVEKPKFISNELSKSELNAFLEFLYILLHDRVEWFEEEEELYELIKGRIDFKAILKNHPLPPAAISFAQEYTKGSGDFIKLLQETQKYRAEMKNWENYQHWLKTRNPERAALEARIGFDCKHGVHVLRLLTQGIELLKTGYLQVDRTGIDAKHLLNVRLGNVSYEDLMAEVDSLMLEINESYQNSKLPKEPNYEKINELTVELVQEGLSKH